MCGICGYFGQSDLGTKKNMMEAIAYRGPDDAGFYDEDNVFLGHTRLSIIDTSSLGHQPMKYLDKVMVFNGEIYNYIELKKELEILGHCFKTNTDSEVLLHAYSEWGTSSFNKLRGMWAFAIYDTTKKSLLLSRDRFGIKPLYYYCDNNRLVFGSDISALIEAGIVKQPNMEKVVDYIIYGEEDNGHDTFFLGVNQLPAGHNLLYNVLDHNIAVSCYYNLKERVEKSSENSIFETELFTTIKQHLRSDVKMGFCLSGGLDSSSLVGVSSGLGLINDQNSIAITAKSEYKRNDETGYAKLVAEHCKLNWIIAYPKYEDFIKYHEHALRIQREPVGSPSMFMQYWVMKTAHENGIKVMIDGQGADEVLLGYERYYVAYLRERLSKFGIWDFLVKFSSIVQKSKLSYTTLLKYYVYYSVPCLSNIYKKRKFSFVKSEIRNECLKRKYSELYMPKSLLDLQDQELTSAQLPHLLRSEDRNSMAFAIESRVPFVDHVLVESALKLGFDQKISDGYTKYPLRKLVERFLPKEIVWRKNKIGFEAPESIWLSKYSNEMQKKVNSSRLIKSIVNTVPDLGKLGFREKWRLYNLAVWYEQNF